MRDLLADYERFLATGKPFGRAVVTSVWGSAPRPEGSCMLTTSEGTIAGSVSGGCVETATALEIEGAIGRGSPKLVTFGVTDERAWEVGLACGGTIKVFVEPSVRPEVLQAARGPGGEVVVSVIAGSGLGRSVRVLDDGQVAGKLPTGIPADAVRDAAREALKKEASTSQILEATDGPVTLFFEVFPRQPRLVIFGGVQIAVALVPLAKALGYHTIVADGARHSSIVIAFRRLTSSSSPGPQRRLTVSGSIRRATSVFCRTTPSLTSRLSRSRSGPRPPMSGRSDHGRRSTLAASASAKPDLAMLRSGACMARSAWISEAGSRRRPRWRFWRR
ncbi:MAG: XdhC family protein [Gemmatimonadales bacterium]